MEIIVTDEGNPDFLRLCDELDGEYFDLHGDIALEYRDYNKISSPHVAVLAIDEGTAIGCGSYKVSDFPETVEIKRVFVRKDYRRQGIATLMIETLEKIAINNGFRSAVLETGSDNAGALGTYRKLGYEIIDNFGFFEDDDLCVCMKKDFGSP